MSGYISTQGERPNRYIAIPGGVGKQGGVTHRDVHRALGCPREEVPA